MSPGIGLGFFAYILSAAEHFSAIGWGIQGIQLPRCMIKNACMRQDKDIFGTAASSAFQDLAPLALLVVVLTLLSHWVAGDLAIPLVGDERLALIAAFTAICGIFYPIAYVLPPIVDRIVQGKATEPMPPPWKRKTWSPVAGAVVMILTVYGITASGNLTELYRSGATTWHDELLWQLEYPLFSSLRGAWLDRPQFWDGIYFLLWPFILTVALYTHSADGVRRYAMFGMAIVFSFYLTRCVNLAFPTAGPAFFQPGWFTLDGTLTQSAQDAVREFTAGRLPANGICPATMAMPSLHVGMTGIAAWFLARRRCWTLLFSIPWLLLIWMSTVVLGWHYILDGLGGLGVGGMAILMAAAVQNAWDRYFALRRAPIGAGGFQEGIPTWKMPETTD